MKITLITLASIVFVIAGTALSGVGSFYALYYGLRAVCLLARNDDYMVLAFSGIIIVPAALLIGFVGSCFAAILVLEKYAEREKSAGFEVIHKEAENPKREVFGPVRD